MPNLAAESWPEALKSMPHPTKKCPIYGPRFSPIHWKSTTLPRKIVEFRVQELVVKLGKTRPSNEKSSNLEAKNWSKNGEKKHDPPTKNA